MPTISPENLIFLISQPRSGSSLLQQILISTGAIKSVPEPWFMLPLVYLNKDSELESGYNHHYAHINFRRYLSNHQNSKNLLNKIIKDASLELYNLNRLEGSETHFLDKTPRYYHIVNELLDLFPESQFIVLTRNPVSVFSSILGYNLNGSLENIFKSDRLDDIFKALDVIKELKKVEGTIKFRILY